MDINKVKALLDSMPISESAYELKNFKLETYGSFPRQLRAALLEKESISNDLDLIEAEIELLAHDSKTNDEADATRRSIQERKTAIEMNMLERQRLDLRARLKLVDAWLDDQDPDMCTDAAEQFEDGESDYWTEHLGRLSAVEILSAGRVRPDTMEKMAQLPLADYKKAVAITTQLAEFLKQTTVQVEETLFPSQDGLPNGDQVAEQPADTNQ